MNTPETQPPASLGAAPCSPDWRSIADDLAAALERLDALYRSEQDPEAPMTRPEWLRHPWQRYHRALADSANSGRVIADMTHDPREGSGDETRRYDAAIIAHAFNILPEIVNVLKSIVAAADDPDNESDKDLVQSIDWTSIRGAIRKASTVTITT